MDTNILDELIEEIRNMTPEEYNAYHEEALKMKKAADKIFGERNPPKDKVHWHDLRDNPTNLPKFYKKVYVKLATGDYTFAMCGKNYNDELTWWYRPLFEKPNQSCEIIYYKVIAWCVPPKLPTFDE